MEPAERPSFRPIEVDDLPTVHRWLNDPTVVRWWEGDDVSWDAVRRDYGPGRRDDGTEHWIALAGGRPVGWIQCYPVAAAPEEHEAWAAHGVGEGAAGIDYLIGEPGDRGRGLGSAMIAAFVDDVVFGRHPGWTQACASPYEANEASWRALARAGFRYVATIADDGGPCRLMVRDRPVRERG